MHLQIEIECPQCGGEITFPEDSLVIKCRYCLSSLVVVGHDGVLTYYVPTRVTPGNALVSAEEELVKREAKSGTLSLPMLFYFPFWRLKAMVLNWSFFEREVKETKCLFSVSENGETFATPYKTSNRKYVKELGTSSLDLGLPAFGSLDPGVKRLAYESTSVHLRLLASVTEKDGVFLPPTIEARTALNNALKKLRKRFDLKRGSLELSETRIIGKALSLVYTPFYCVLLDKGDQSISVLLEAIGGRVTAVMKGNGAQLILEGGFSRRNELKTRNLRFIPLRCLECGWDFQSTVQSKVLLCQHCGRAWEEYGGSLRNITYDVAAPPAREKTSLIHMPFWKLRVNIRIIDRVVSDVKGFRNMLSFSLYPKDLNPERELFFYIPAFRLKQAEEFDRLASQITRLQPEIRWRTTDLLTQLRFGDVQVSREEAREMSMITYLTLITDQVKTGMEPLLKAKIQILSVGLIYLPFVDDFIYLREPVTRVHFHKKSVLGTAGEQSQAAHSP
jgi:DNA-directed RNA polymerase subunit RPC12/RpoP